MKSNSNLKYIIPDSLAGKRLDAALATLSGFSRSSLTSLLKKGLVSLDGATVDRDYKVTTGQVVDITISTSVQHPRPEIIAETDEYIVINKPTGILAHGKAGHNSPIQAEYTIADWVRAYVKSVGELDPLRPGIVHRLDRAVSGAMVIAKTAKAAAHLKSQFASRAVTKEYTALVLGKVQDDSGTITFPLIRSGRTGRIAARPKGSGGREAITEYTVLKRLGSTTLLSITIKTGRMHQIRAHLLAIGHPVAGDTVYAKNKTGSEEFPRLMLHSTRLGFTDTDGKWQEYIAEPPKEFTQAIRSLEK